MLPHGARCTANPRVTTATRCATTPIALSVTAARTHGPASQIARNADCRREGSPAAGPAPAGGTTPSAPPTTAAPTTTAAPPSPVTAPSAPAADVAPTVPAAPTAVSSATR